MLRKSRNPLMDLRKICNHPFLVPGVEPPGDTLGEDLVGSSGKLALLDRMLVQLKARGHKVLVFSQMTRVLDILESYCCLRGFSACRLDGQTGVEERQQQMRLFNSDPR